MLARSVALVSLCVLATPPRAQDARMIATRPPCPGTEVELVGPAAGTDDLGFGASVALDGDRLLVGAPGHYTTSVPGAIQVFERVSGRYAFVRRIVPDDSAPDDLFGDRIVVRDGWLYSRNATHVLVLERDQGGPGQWGQIASIPASGSTASFAVDPGGDVVAIGDGVNVYLHERNLGGPNAFGVAAVVPAPASPPVFFFGLRLELDGDVLVAVAADSFIHPYSWFVFFFERDLGGPNAWGLSHRLPEGSPFGGYLLGQDTALLRGLVWVEDTLRSSLYARGVGGSPWTLVDRIESCLDPECDEYRVSLSIAARGRHVARSVVQGDGLADEYGLEVYRRTTSTAGTPGLALIGEAWPPSPHSSFGAGIDVQGDLVVVGAPEASGLTGVVHVFELEDCFARAAPTPVRR